MLLHLPPHALIIDRQLVAYFEFCFSLGFCTFVLQLFYCFYYEECYAVVRNYTINFCFYDNLQVTTLCRYVACLFFFPFVCFSVLCDVFRNVGQKQKD